MAYYDALVTKWPTVSGANQAAKLTTLNAEMVSVAATPPSPLIVQSHQLYEAIDTTEFGALSAANQALIRDLLNMGSVSVATGTKARARLAAAFTNASGPTRLALTALEASFASRSMPWWQAPTPTGGGLSSPVAVNDLAAAGLS